MIILEIKRASRKEKFTGKATWGGEKERTRTNTKYKEQGYREFKGYLLYFYMLTSFEKRLHRNLVPSYDVTCYL